VVEQQLQRGGIRLAAMLNSPLSAAHAATTPAGSPNDNPRRRPHWRIIKLQNVQEILDEERVQKM
jgi:hypothetical protein